MALIGNILLKIFYKFTIRKYIFISSLETPDNRQIKQDLEVVLIAVAAAASAAAVAVVTIVA